MSPLSLLSPTSRLLTPAAHLASRSISINIPKFRSHLGTMPNKWSFEAVPGVFPDYPELHSQTGDKISTLPNLGLINRAYPSDDSTSSTSSTSGDATPRKDWTRFADYVRSLNRDAPPNVSYKVLYLSRHGFGFHNKKQAEVGDEEWDNNWSLKDGDGVTTWFDSFLADEGVQQVTELGKFWVDLVGNNDAPLPQTLYCSPMARCLQTTEYAFGPVMKANNAPFKPIVKDGLRERWTMHTCDKRRPKSWIQENWGPKGYTIEDGFPEEDLLGQTDRPETHEEHMARKQKAFEEIFESDEGEFLSLIVHSMAIRAIMAVCKVDRFRVREGSSLALLVKGEKL